MQPEMSDAPRVELAGSRHGAAGVIPRNHGTHIAPTQIGGRMAVGFLDPLGRVGKTEQYPRWYLLV